MLGNFLIGLREGLEAALVVSILVAYLVKTDRRHLLPRIWLGVGLVVVLCGGLAVGLDLTARQLPGETQELIGGTLSLVAAAFVTWMIFWMAGAARSMGTRLRGQVDAVADGSGWGLVLVAVLSVGREGLETALILWSNTVQATAGSGGERTAAPILGALAGLGVAVALGYLLYRGAVSIDLSRFFTRTGVLLVVVAAGVVSYGFHDLQEAHVLPGEHAYAFDVSSVIAPGSWLATLLKGTLNLSPQTTWVAALAWVAYVVPVMVLFVLRVRRPGAPTGGGQARVPAAA